VSALTSKPPTIAEAVKKQTRAETVTTARLSRGRRVDTDVTRQRVAEGKHRGRSRELCLFGANL